MNFTQTKTFYNNKPIEYIIKETYNDLKEDREFIPRFSLKKLRKFL